MMEQAIKDGAGSGNIAQEFTPFFDGTIGGHHGGSVFVAAHNEFQEDFPTFLRQDFKSHVINKCGASHLLINVESSKMWSCILGS